MLRISVDIDPAMPNVSEITAAIRLLQRFIGSGAMPGLPVAGEDGPDVGLDPDVQFGEHAALLANGPSADAAFGGAQNFTPPPPPPGAMPPALAAAPTPTAGATITPAGTDLDAEGLPWDGRIHSDTKTRLKAENTWKLKRGVDPAQVATVKAELRALMAIPGAAGFTPAAPAQTPPPVPPVPGSPAHPAAGGVSATSPTPNANGYVAPATPPASTPAPAASTVSTFVEFVGKWAPQIQAGKITQAEMGEACAMYGIPALPLLANRNDLVPSIDTYLTAVAAMKG